MNIKFAKNPLSWITSLSLGLIVTTPLYALEFPSAPDKDPPQSTAGAGVRGTPCIAPGTLPLQAFALGEKNKINTASSQPQIFVYLPKTKAEFIEFSLTKTINGEDENVNQQKIPISKGDHVIKIQIPYNAVLEDNQIYNWSVSLLCSPRKPTGGKTFEKGTLTKVTLSPETKTQLVKNPVILDKARIYAEQGIWSETVSLVSQVRNSQPQEWNELLTSVGLEKYADKEFYQVSLW